MLEPVLARIFHPPLYHNENLQLKHAAIKRRDGSVPQLHTQSENTLNPKQKEAALGMFLCQMSFVYCKDVTEHFSFKFCLLTFFPLLLSQG